MHGTFPFTPQKLAGLDVDVYEAPSMTACIDIAYKCALNGRERDEVEAVRPAAEAGMKSVVDASERLMDQIEAELDLTGQGLVQSPAVAGGAVNVPAFLSGSPMAMRQKRRAPDQSRGEVVVMLNTYGASGTSRTRLKHRGAAALALVRALAGVRPVSLFLFEVTDAPRDFGGRRDEGGALVTVEIETRPVDLARASWGAGSREFTIDTLVPIQRRTRFRGRLAQARPGTIKRVLHGWAEDRGAGSLVITPSLLSRDGGDAFDTMEGAVAWTREALATVREGDNLAA